MGLKMAQEVVIAYETLFEILKRERERADLQKLEPTFFTDTINYIKEKKKIMEAKSDSPIVLEEKKKTERQLENIYKIIKDIYERREKKIISMAFDKSRTRSILIDTTALLKEEKVVFEALTNLLDTYRGAILYNVLNEQLPFMQPMPAVEASQAAHDFKSASELKRPIELKKTTRLVRFVHAIPKFVGPELEEYGPFGEEDIANLPKEIVDVLISKGNAEEIKEE